MIIELLHDACQETDALQYLSEEDLKIADWLSNFLIDKILATKMRLAGRIQLAMELERSAEHVFEALPEKYQW